MTIYKRFVLLLTLCILIATLLVLRSGVDTESLRRFRTPEGQEPLDVVEDEATTLESSQASDEEIYILPTDTKVPISEEISPFPPGIPKAPGSSYTKAVVMGQLLSEDTTWLDTEDFPSTIQKYIYNTDKDSLPSNVTSFTSPLLSVPEYKGHEAMVYLTYMITNYDTLPDVSIFMHAHQHAWHNEQPLNHDAVEMIKRLSAERVVREGYVNLRCQWNPGCPDQIHPHATEVNEERPEEWAIRDAWDDLFPGDDLPMVLATSCCAQFALSKERIQSIPVHRYEKFRQWLIDTPEDDYVSGRVFEYLWHRIFTGQSVVCPDMLTCYCDGYGLCFEDENELNFWFKLRQEKREFGRKLEQWEMLVDKYKEVMAKDKGKFRGKGGHGELKGLKVPAVDGDVVLQKNIDELSLQLEQIRLKALEAGTDPRRRAEVAGRAWEDGDGY